MIKCNTHDLMEEILSRLADATACICFDKQPMKKNSLILQRFCSKWDTFIDVKNIEDVLDGDRIRVIPNPIIPSKEVWHY